MRLVKNYETTHYLFGTAAGPLPLPPPCPPIVERISKMIGEETKRQILEREGRLPDML